MARTMIKDSSFKTIGYLETQGKFTYAYKAGGQCVGHYDSDTDNTYKAGGSFVGKGNLAATLLFND